MDRRMTTITCHDHQLFLITARCSAANFCDQGSPNMSKDRHIESAPPGADETATSAIGHGSVAGVQQAHTPSADRVGAGGKPKKAILLLVLLIGATASIAALSNVTSSSGTLNGKRTNHLVSRGELIVSVKERGTLESSSNTEIKCQIRGGYGGRGGESTVTWVIPPGSIVKKGDELVKLDTKVIEETISLGKTDTNNARAELARAQADLAKAKIAIDSYLNGTFRSQMQALEKELDENNRNLRIAKEILGKSQELFQQGFVTELEIEGNKYSVEQANYELNVTKTRMDVLSRLTKEMQMETLEGQVIATEARLAGREAGVVLEQGKLDLALQEFDKSTIRAPKDGLVIYPSTAKWKNSPDITEGASVRNNQVLLVMPDVSKMQVNVGVHEAIIDRVKAGLPAIVTLPGQTLETKVDSVASVASPVGWWNGNTVRYDTIIQLPSVNELKPGMSAEVEVILARYDEVLSVPVSAIVETPEGHYCWVENGDKPQRRSLQIGDSNDEFVLIESGITEGERVVLNPVDTIEEAKKLIAPALVHTVQRGDLTVTLTEQGTLESSDNTLVKCRVRGASTVISVIENGTEVQIGDELVRLENKQIEEYLHERTKFNFLSKDAAIGFRAHANRAGLAIAEYLEGRFVTELLTLEKDRAISAERLGTAQNVLRHTKMMYDRGYISELELERKQFAVTEARLNKENIETEIDVLKRFTKNEELATLKGDWEAAKAAANGHEEVLKMDSARIALAKQELDRCVIKAERSGLVVYPRSEQWKDAPDIAEGATVHNDQVLLLMPDLSRMQVRLGIHETMIDQVKTGMATEVTLPKISLDGEITSIASTAQPAGWWAGNIVKYDAIVELPSVEGLKPGMTAEVEITLAKHQDVLTIPIGAVIETNEGSFCWVGEPDRAERRPIVLGDSNETSVIVIEGLQAGERVLRRPPENKD